MKTMFVVGATLAATLTGNLAAAFAAAATPDSVVHIKNFTFSPEPLRTRAGAHVRFINDDDEAHTVTASDKSFDSQGLDTGGTWDHVFTKPGTYRYFCELHPYMKATIVVTK